MYLALQAAAAANHPSTAEKMMRETLESHGLEVEYAVVRSSTGLRQWMIFSSQPGVGGGLVGWCAVD